LLGLPCLHPVGHTDYSFSRAYRYAATTIVQTISSGLMQALGPQPRLNKSLGSSVAAVALEQSRTEQKTHPEQSGVFALNKPNSLTA
jgi:hypothetical protein